MYLVVTSGIVVNVHYCMDKVTSMDYGYVTSDKCQKCGMEGKKNCCHTDHQVIKVSDVHQLAKANVDIASPSLDIICNQVHLLQPLQGVEPSITLQYHSPPASQGTSVYLYNSVFRI